MIETRRERRGCEWFGFVSHGLALLSDMTRIVPYVCCPTVSTEPVEREKEEGSITAAKGLAGALSGAI